MVYFINKVVWLFATFFIIFFSLFYSVKLRGVQFRFFSMFKSLKKSKDNVSSFGLLMTSLAGRIGVGSIAGVVLSIYVGGVGSIFWMWVSTFLCAVITYCETILGVKYKVWTGCNYRGGPAYYIRDGLGNKFLGGVYSILIIVSYIGCFLGIQSNTISKCLNNVFSINVYIVGFLVVFITFFCICGGFKKIVSVSEKLVPFMTFIYVGSSFIVLLLNLDKIYNVFILVLKSAFNFKSFFGGFIPMFIIGFQRGVFSNEAGLGTSSIVASSSSSDDFKTQGFIQMLGIYITTLIICTSTCIILLSSDYHLMEVTDINGIELALYAFKYHFGNIGTYIMILSVLLFSFSTIFTGYYYGESCLEYFVNVPGYKHIYILRVVTLIILFIGCFVSSLMLWSFVDILVGIIVIINLYSIYKLRDKIE